MQIERRNFVANAKTGLGRPLTLVDGSPQIHRVLPCFGEPYEAWLFLDNASARYHVKLSETEARTIAEELKLYHNTALLNLLRRFVDTYADRDGFNDEEQSPLIREAIEVLRFHGVDVT